MRNLVNTRLVAILIVSLASGLTPALADDEYQSPAPSLVRLSATQPAAVHVGQSEALRTMLSYDRIAIGNPDVLDASRMSSRELAIHGKMVGTTNVLAYNGDRVVQSFYVEVTQDVASAETTNGAYLPQMAQAAYSPAEPETTSSPPVRQATGQPSDLTQLRQIAAQQAYLSAPPAASTQYGIDRDAIVKVGQSEPLRTSNSFDKITVANDELLDVTPISDREFLVRGKVAGETNILVYKGGTMVQSFNVEVTQDVSAIMADLLALYPDHSFNVRRVGRRIFIEGEVDDDQMEALVVSIVESYSEGGVINALTIESPRQVVLQVRFLEASRQSIKELGLGNVINRVGDFSFSTGAGLVSGFAPNTAGVLNGGSGSVGIDVLVNALEEKGVIRTLAEPNLVATSGESASFLAGGEFPVPIAAEYDRVTIEFREFGVGLEFEPTVIGNDRVALAVRPEVSQIDPRNSVRLAGFEIPALIVRKADTHVELRSGQTFAIAGLLQNAYDNEVMQTPFLGDVPILGTLFRSTRFRENETELIILVTPTLLNSGDDYSPVQTELTAPPRPSQQELFLLGNVEAQGALQ